VKLGKLCKDEIGHVALRPVLVKGITNAKSVACGEAHTLVLDGNGEVWGFGWGEDG